MVLDCDVAGIFTLEVDLNWGAPFATFRRAAVGFVALTADFLGLRFAGVAVLKISPHASVSAVTVARRIFRLDRARTFLKGSYI